MEYTQTGKASFFENTAQHSHPVETTLNLAAVRQRMGLDPAQHRQLFAMFIDSTPPLLDELAEALESGCLSTTGMLAHRLKSSARAVGADALGRSCELIERASKENKPGAVKFLVPLLVSQAGEAMEALQFHCVEVPLREPLAAQPARAGARVLFLDDDIVTLESGKSMLENMGAKEVVTVRSGGEALRWVTESDVPFDLVMCDLNMPGMDGLQFLRALSQARFSRGIVLVSGEEDRIIRMTEQYARARALSILGAISKPLSRERLQDILSACTNDSGEQKPAPVNSAQEIVTVEELRCGLLNGEIDVHLQPKVDIATGRATGFEALARWHHAERGPIPPGLFIPLAEKHGLIDSLTQAVMERSFYYGRQIREQGSCMKVSVNLSVDSLARLDWPEYATELAVKAGLEPSNIIFEITESGTPVDLSTMLEVLTRLRLRGFGLSVDDFGTGYASMEQLRKGPFSELKIDRMFINGADDDADTRMMLESSVGLAKKLGMEIIAEGVETQAQWDMVAELGCDQVQGYFVARPMPVGEFEQWLMDREQQPQPAASAA